MLPGSLSSWLMLASQSSHCTYLFSRLVLHMHVPVSGFCLFFLACDAENVCRYFSVVLHKPNKQQISSGAQQHSATDF